MPEAARGTPPAAREYVLAALAGVLLGGAFLPGPFGFLAWIGFVPLLEALALRARAGGRFSFRLGYAFGLAYYLMGTHWIALLSDVATTVPWIKYPAWLAAGAYLAVYAGLSAWLALGLVRRAGLGLAVVFPFAFLLVEELRASGELGFPWFQPGYSQHAYPAVVQLASLGSVTLVTLWLYVVNVLAWRAWRATPPARPRAIGVAALVFALPWAAGYAALARAKPADGPAVGLIQGNIAGEIKWAGTHQRQILDTYLRLSEQAARDPLAPRLLIWPETATGSYLIKQPEQVERVRAFTASNGVSLFSGLADYDYGPADALRYHNAAALVPPSGVIPPVYAKRHLVPFGERMPFQWLIPKLGTLDMGQAEWTPGDSTVLFDSEAGPFSCLVCFESIFPDLAREDVRKGARWLVNVTNDEWFGNGAALFQHAAMSVFRAAENRVPLARCANTGLTMLVDSHGRVTHRVPVFREAVLVARLDRPGPPTLYGRVGDWPGLLALALVLGLALAGVVRRRA